MNKIQQTTRARAVRTRRAFGGIAIAAALTIALAGAAFAIYHSSLKDLAGPILPNGAEDVHTLSLNGLAGSPEYEAAREWESYVDARYAEGENMMAPDSAPDAYFQYNAFSREAKDTLDDILDKYDLKMHDAPAYVRSLDELYSALGASGFMPAVGGVGEYPVSGTLYEDGTFSFNCAAALPNGMDVLYQFYHLNKGALTRIGFLNADADDFEEWTYTTPSGTEVVLGFSANKSVMAANLDNCFIFVNILSGTENSNENKSSYGAQPVEKRDLEVFADSFDFTALNDLKR
jgi:hypothetical protein